MTPVELTFKMFLYFTTQLGFCDKLCYENGFYSLYQVVAYYRIISILETDGFVKNIYRLIIFKLKCLLISHEYSCDIYFFSICDFFQEHSRFKGQ